MTKCKVSGCEKVRATNGTACNMHAARWFKHKSYDTPTFRANGSALIRDAQGNKYCPRCCQWLNEDQFSTSPYASDKLKSPCTQCTNVARWGLTRSSYEALLDEQSGVCALCYQPPTARRLAVDHDHTCCPDNKSCGRCIRGLLCHPCNTGLGLFRDSTEVLGLAISYLESSR